MITNETRERMKQKVLYHAMKMRELRKKKGIDCSVIAKEAGLNQATVWRFMNEPSPKTAMITYILIAKALDYELEFS